MGLPWPAHRNQSRPATGRQEIADEADGCAPGMPQVCAKNISICSASNSSALGYLDAGTALLDHDSAVRIGGAGDVLRLLRKGISSTKACARSTGASTTKPLWPKRKSSMKTTRSPTIWVKYPLTEDPAKTRSSARPERKSSPSFGRLLLGRCRLRWRWPSIRMKSMSLDGVRR